MRARLRFYSDIVGVVFCGGALGYFVAKGEWIVASIWVTILVVGIPAFFSRYAPRAAEHKESEVGRRQAELQYEHRERLRSGDA